jgi:anti-sigma regulatory factor (Ser/Thr protein kinase)
VRAEEGRRPGGFGILLTRNLVDELLYNERGNAVLFVKYLQGKAEKRQIQPPMNADKQTP